MLKNKKLRSTEQHLKTLQLEIVVVFTILLFAVTFFLSEVALTKSKTAMQDKVSTLVAANSRQLELNIDSYLDKVESTSALLFSDEIYYGYDETDDSIEDYDKVKNEEAIVDRIVDIGLMENFSDFGIVYSDDYKVGWISRVTSGMFPEGGIYDEFSEYVVNEKTNDGWVFGVKGNVDRLYYVKRLNDNALLIASFYTRELANVFRFPEELEQMTVRLVNDDNRIMYSSTVDEIGEQIPENITKLISSDKESTMMNDEYLVNVNYCDNGWRVVCDIPTEVILKENNEMKNFITVVARGLAIFMVLVGIIMFARISKPLTGMVSNLEEKATLDQLSGLMNKVSFEEEVKGQIAAQDADKYRVMIVTDVDNFKSINDNLGHAYGDKVIARMGYLLGGTFYEGFTIGRIGGDEFALYMELDKLDADGAIVEKETVTKTVTDLLDQLLVFFGEEFAVEQKKYNVSISAGTYVSADEDMTFETMYKCADAALYVSKRSGKNQYTVYQEGMKGEEK